MCELEPLFAYLRGPPSPVSSRSPARAYLPPSPFHALAHQWQVKRSGAGLQRCWSVAVRGDASLTGVRCRCDGADRVEASAGGPAAGGANREEAREEARRSLTACCLLLDPTVPTHSFASLLRCPMCGAMVGKLECMAEQLCKLACRSRTGMKLGCACCSESTIHQEANAALARPTARTHGVRYSHGVLVRTGVDQA